MYSRCQASSSARGWRVSGRELEGEELVDVQGAGLVLLVEPDVLGFLYLAVDDAFADQELRPLEIGVAGDEGVVKVEEGEVHGVSSGRVSLSSSRSSGRVTARLCSSV
jgi:hypothetical protein